MGKIISPQDFPGVICDEISRIRAASEKALTKEARRAYTNSIYEMTAYTRSNVKKINKKVVDTFYSSYSPKEYTSRRYSMMNVIKFESKVVPGSAGPKSSLVNTIIEDEFAMPLRDGSKSDYLYNTAFVSGYHGGASSGPRHPNEGTPYWRVPTGYWGQWGRPAEVTRSPQEYFNSRMDRVPMYRYFNDMFRDKLSLIKEITI